MRRETICGKIRQHCWQSCEPSSRISPRVSRVKVVELENLEKLIDFADRYRYRSSLSWKSRGIFRQRRVHKTRRRTQIKETSLYAAQSKLNLPSKQKLPISIIASWVWLQLLALQDVQQGLQLEHATLHHRSPEVSGNYANWSRGMRRGQKQDPVCGEQEGREVKICKETCIKLIGIYTTKRNNPYLVDCACEAKHICLSRDRTSMCHVHGHVHPSRRDMYVSGGLVNIPKGDIYSYI